MTLNASPQMLKALRSVIELGSLTAAAEQSGFTQSALSKQIAALEAVAGMPLLTRLPRGVKATEAGRRLALRAAAVLDQLDAAQRELDALDPTLTGRVTVGAFPTAAFQLIPQALARLHIEHPSIEVEFFASSTPVQLRRLRAGRLDLVVLSDGFDLPALDATGLQTHTLATGALHVAASEQHDLARFTHLDVAQLADHKWIVGAGAPGEAQFGAWPTLPNPRISASLTEWPARLGFVAAGLGLTTVPSFMRHVLPRNVVARPVHDPALRPRRMLLAHVGPLSPHAAAVATAITREALIASSAA